MKNGMITIIICTLLGVTFPGKEVQSQSEEIYQTIPDEAIRLRILANSDSEEDQRIKRIVRDEVNHYITDLVQYIDDIQEARRTIQDQLPTIKEIVEDTLINEGSVDDFDVEYSSNVSFPTKVYDRFIYPAGEYEAVLISLGDGNGANWWCVLFPPLCFLDFSNGSTVQDTSHETTEGVQEQEMDVDTESEIDHKESEDQEVRFFLFEWLDWS